MHQTFTHPSLLLALTALPVVSVLAFLAGRRRQRALRHLAGPVAAILLARRGPAFPARLATSLGLTCLALGMAGPRWGRDWSQSTAPGRDLVVVLDQSRSMYAEAPSRLEQACTALDELARTLEHRGGHRVALIVFAGRPRLVCPLTHDLDHFRESVAAVDRSVPDATLGTGTRIGAALALGADTFEGRSAAARDLLLLTDGDDPARDGEWRRGIDRARAAGAPVTVVGVGDPGEGHRIPDGTGWLRYEDREVRTRLETAPLRAIADATRGELYLPGGRPFPLGEHYLARTATTQEDSPDALPVLRQRQTWFLLPAFLLLSIALLLPLRGPSS